MHQHLAQNLHDVHLKKKVKKKSKINNNHNNNKYLRGFGPEHFLEPENQTKYRPVIVSPRLLMTDSVGQTVGKLRESEILISSTLPKTSADVSSGRPADVGPSTRRPRTQEVS